MSTRTDLRSDMDTARHAQQMRAEAAALGYKAETLAFYGSDKHPPADHPERRLTLADADKEARRRAQHDRELARHYREWRSRLINLTPDQVYDEALAHTADAWKATGLWAIATLAATGRTFQAVDLLDLGVEEPDHPNRWGALFNLAARAGLIRHRGYTASDRPSVRHSIVRTWSGIR